MRRFLWRVAYGAAYFPVSAAGIFLVFVQDLICVLILALADSTDYHRRMQQMTSRGPGQGLLDVLGWLADRAEGEGVR